MHGPAAKLETDHAAAKKAKLGIKLFIFYILIYAGFVVIGFVGLIVLAIVMGFIYNAMCSRLEDKMNIKGGK